MKCFVAAAVPLVALFLVLSVLQACSVQPGPTITYHLPKVELDVTVTATVACSTTNEPRFVTTVAVVPTFTRNDAMKREVRTANLDKWHSNADFGFTFTPDGRLAGVNAAQTGQGGEIVKSLVTLGSTIAALGRSTTGASTCDQVRQLGTDKGVTVTLAARESFETDSVDRPLSPTPDSDAVFQTIEPLLGAVCLKGRKLADVPPRVVADSGDLGAVKLHLIQPAAFELTVSRAAGCAENGQTPLWSGHQDVPQRGQEFTIPLPKPTLFGKRTIIVAMAESGAVTALRYATESGAAAAANAATALAAPFKAPPSADAASEIKAKADLIAQQQRLTRCLKGPETCT